MKYRDLTKMDEMGPGFMPWTSAISQASCFLMTWVVFISDKSYGLFSSKMACGSFSVNIFPETDTSNLQLARHLSFSKAPASHLTFLACNTHKQHTNNHISADILAWPHVKILLDCWSAWGQRERETSLTFSQAAIMKPLEENIHFLTIKKHHHKGLIIQLHVINRCFYVSWDQEFRQGNVYCQDTKKH